MATLMTGTQEQKEVRRRPQTGPKDQYRLENLEATEGIEPPYTDLQSAASPLRHVASRRRVISERGCIDKGAAGENPCWHSPRPFCSCPAATRHVGPA